MVTYLFSFTLLDIRILFVILLFSYLFVLVHFLDYEEIK